MSGFSGAAATVPVAVRVVHNDETVVIADTECLVLVDYVTVEGATGTLVIEGDGALLIL